MIVIGMCTIATISMGCYIPIVKNTPIKTSEIIKMLLNHVLNHLIFDYWIMLILKMKKKNRNMSITTKISTIVEKMKIGEMMKKMMKNQMKIGKMKIGKMKIGKMKIGKMKIGQIKMNIGKMKIGNI